MSFMWNQLDDQAQAILDGYGGEGVVAVRPSLVRALRGNGNAAILVSQLLYWSRRLGDDEGWFYQAQRRLATQTGLGPDAQRKAVQLLVRLGVLEADRRGVPAKLYYRLDLPRLAALLLAHGQTVLNADHAQRQDVDHGLQLDSEHGPQLAAGDGRPQAAGHGPQHKKRLIPTLKKRLQGIPPPSPPQGLLNPRQKRGRRSTPKHSLPEDFTVTPAMRAWAAEHAPQVDLDHETQKLVAWAGAKGVWRSDWLATWRLWMLNSAKPGLRGQRRPSSPPERHAGIRTWLNEKRGYGGDAP